MVPENQITIYDYFDIEDDPLYQTLVLLKRNEKVSIGHVEVCLNRNGIYEITSSQIHEGTSSLFKCYDYLSHIHV